MPAVRTKDLEVELRTEHSKAVIEGKTSVPFKTFVQLILQRKVLTLFKKWGDEPVIISSELLTNLASAPQDTQEDKTHVVIVTLGVGVLVGVFVAAIAQLILSALGITMGQKELLIVAGSIVGLAFLAVILMRTQRAKRSQKIADTMEKMAGLLSK